MKTLDQVLKRFSTLNSGYDLSKRSTGLKLVIVIGMFLVMALAVMGVLQ